MASLHWQLYPNFTLYSCLKNCRKVICSEIKGWLSCYFGVATISLGVAWKTPCEQVPPSHSFSFISPVFQQNCSYARFCLCFECGMLIEQKVGVAGRSGEVQKWTRWGPSLLSFVSLGKQKLTLGRAGNQSSKRLCHLQRLTQHRGARTQSRLAWLAPRPGFSVSAPFPHACIPYNTVEREEGRNNPSLLV